MEKWNNWPRGFETVAANCCRKCSDQCQPKPDTSVVCNKAGVSYYYLIKKVRPKRQSYGAPVRAWHEAIAERMGIAEGPAKALLSKAEYEMQEQLDRLPS